MRLRLSVDLKRYPSSIFNNYTLLQFASNLRVQDFTIAGSRSGFPLTSNQLAQRPYWAGFRRIHPNNSRIGTRRVPTLDTPNQGCPSTRLAQLIKIRGGYQALFCVQEREEWGFDSHTNERLIRTSHRSDILSLRYAE